MAGAPAIPPTALTASTISKAVLTEQPSIMPAAFAWALAAWTPRVYGVNSIGYVADPVSPYADVGITPEALFDLYSTARTAPANTYYVDVSAGSDANACTAAGASACKSCNHAVVLANAATGSSTINVNNNGVYYRAYNCAFGIATGPTHDLALISTNGRSTICNCDIMTWAATGTANTYSTTLANANRAMDTANLNAFGNYTDLINVATQALVNATPGSWSIVTGVLYLQRTDGVAPATANTRVYRASSPNIVVSAGVSLYLNGFDLEGGQTGVVNIYNSANPGSDHAAVITNTSMKYAGGAGPNAVDITPSNLQANSYRGIVACFNCRSDAAASDGYNQHSSLYATPVSPYFLVVNSSAYDNGRGQNSSNCLTHHETGIAIWAGNICIGNHGGSVRSINSTQAWIVDNNINYDMGDIQFGGVVYPTAFQADNTAVYWLDANRINMPGASRSLYVGTNTATINYRNMLPPRQPYSGAGTVAPY